MTDIEEEVKIQTDFINAVRITEVKDVDYILHFYNSYSGKAWVFKLYKDLFDKAMEDRSIVPLEPKSGEEAEEEIKAKTKNGVKMMYG